MTTKPTPRAEFIFVGPVEAEFMLTKNLKNRKFKEGRIIKYARDMTNGRFTLNNDAICFDEDGILVNGQNRLAAIIRTGLTIQLLVIYNLPREASINLDSPAARSAADNLHIEGYKDTTQLAAVSKLVLNIDAGVLTPSGMLSQRSTGEIVDFASDNPVLNESIKAAARLYHTRGGNKTGLAAAHFLLYREVGFALAEHYFEKIQSLDNEPKGSPILAVANRLNVTSRMRRDSDGQALKPNRKAYDNEPYRPRNYILLLLKGWNLYAVDGRVSTLTMDVKAGHEFKLPKIVAWQRDYMPTEDNTR